MQYCSLQHQTLFPSPVTSTTGHCFCFGSASSFFLELFLYSSPIAYWAATDLGSSSFSVISFCLFILFMGFLRQEYWSSLPFLSPVDHVLSELFTMTCPSWVKGESEKVGLKLNIQKTKLMESGPINFMGNRWGNSGNSVRLYFSGLQNHCRW